jgi:hydroxylaminobenzene mutase
VAAQLEGLMNGTFLIVLGAIWTEVSLPSAAKGATYWVILYATYANWLFTTLAAVNRAEDRAVLHVALHKVAALGAGR